MRSCKLDYKRPSYHVDETEERKTEIRNITRSYTYVFNTVSCTHAININTIHTQHPFLYSKEISLPI